MVEEIRLLTLPTSKFEMRCFCKSVKGRRMVPFTWHDADPLKTEGVECPNCGRVGTDDDLRRR